MKFLDITYSLILEECYYKDIIKLVKLFRCGANILSVQITRQSQQKYSY